MRNGQVLPWTDEVLHIRRDDVPNVEALKGYYQCNVTNTWGTAVSNKTLIQVATEASKRERDHPRYYLAVEGASLTLSCVIDDFGFPPPTVDDISWTRDGVDINQDQRLHFTDKG